MGIVQNLFLAYENPLRMKYIIPENIFYIPDMTQNRKVDLLCIFFLTLGISTFLLNHEGY